MSAEKTLSPAHKLSPEALKAAFLDSLSSIPKNKKDDGPLKIALLEALAFLIQSWPETQSDILSGEYQPEEKSVFSVPIHWTLESKGDLSAELTFTIGKAKTFYRIVPFIDQNKKADFSITPFGDKDYDEKLLTALLTDGLQKARQAGAHNQSTNSI